MTPNRSNRFVPIIIAVSVVAGMIIGTFFANRFSGNRLSIINTSSNKVNDLLHIIDEQYVDTVNISELVEEAMPSIISELDPHSSYISSQNATAANDDLKGSFSGIGVQFLTKNDTVYISNIIQGGPSEKVGLLAGDRIISIDGKSYTGEKVNNEETMRRLKGAKGTKVKLGVLRNGVTKSFTVERGDIPVKSIDATYMLTPNLGYVRVNKFGETTYPELLTSLSQLEQQNFKGLVVDLRGNTGGYLASAIQLVNEFLSSDKLIVYTQGRKSRRRDYRSDGRGSYQSLPIIVLTDEATASSAEIFSGAIQDNDRGLIVGRRTFGKGLVQESIDFADGSIIHLTIARYYTPSGRCIQKPYVKGKLEDYQMDLVTRYNHGEFFHEDSIQLTGEKYKTSIGRTVYGGGGIMPDYFVAEDTSNVTPYYVECVSKGLIQEYCFNYTDVNRSALRKLKTADEIVEFLRRHRVVEDFIRFADTKDVRRRNNMIRQSQQLFEKNIYGSIIYNILDMDSYIKFLNRTDPTVLKAVELFQSGVYRPTVETKKPSTKKRAKASALNTSHYDLQKRTARPGSAAEIGILC